MEDLGTLPRSNSRSSHRDPHRRETERVRDRDQARGIRLREDHRSGADGEIVSGTPVRWRRLVPATNGHLAGAATYQNVITPTYNSIRNTYQRVTQHISEPRSLNHLRSTNDRLQLKEKPNVSGPFIANGGLTRRLHTAMLFHRVIVLSVVLSEYYRGPFYKYGVCNSRNNPGMKSQKLSGRCSEGGP